MLSTKRKVGLNSILMICCTSAIVFGQTKTELQNCKYVACTIDSCSFAEQDTSIEGLKFDYATHVKFFHKTSLTDDQILSLIKKGKYQPVNKNVKCINCPEKDSFVVWSTYDDVLVHFYKQHALIMHNKELKDEDIKKLITRIP